jgi:hypothetical protein
MKKIIVQWVEEETWGYGKAMRVIESNSPRFVAGTRFDFGFFSIATDEGYIIESRPRIFANDQDDPHQPEAAEAPNEMTMPRETFGETVGRILSANDQSDPMRTSDGGSK